MIHWWLLLILFLPDAGICAKNAAAARAHVESLNEPIAMLGGRMQERLKLEQDQAELVFLFWERARSATYLLDKLGDDNLNESFVESYQAEAWLLLQVCWDLMIQIRER